MSRLRVVDDPDAERDITGAECIAILEETIALLDELADRGASVKAVQRPHLRPAGGPTESRDESLAPVVRLDRH